MSEKSYFYIAGVFSAFFYILFFLLFVLYIKSHNVKKIDANLKTTVIELDLIVDDTKQKKVEKIVKKEIKKSEKSEDVVKKSTSNSVKTTGNIQSLFANVSVKAKEVKKEAVNNTEKNTVSSRFKSKFEKEAKNDEVSVSKILDDVKKSNSKLLINSSKEQNDPYYSKIYEILSNGWNPRIIIDDLSARVIITIYNNGKFEFKFLQYSNNSQFDSDLENFLKEQEKVLFPPYENGIKTDIDIIFKSKE